MSLLTKVFNNAIIEGNTIHLDGKKYKIVKGKHSIWIPKAEMKIVWSYNGKITPFRHWKSGKDVKSIKKQQWNDKNRYWDKDSLNSIINEHLIFKMLMEYQLCVGVTGIFYIKNMISDFYSGTLVSDTKGVYGHFMRNAYNVDESGHYTFNIDPDKSGYFRTEVLPDRFTNYIEPLINISAGAKGDMKKLDNIINGYIIDIRRSMFDNMELKELPKDSYKEIEYMENVNELKNKLIKLTQFPHKQREKEGNYQSYYIDGEDVPGARNTTERMDLMNIPANLKERSILDLGCNLGSICCESYKRNGRWILGLDNEADYIECANDLARHNGYNITYMVKDLTDTENTAIYINSFFGEAPGKNIGTIFALSLYKHIKGKLFDLLDRLTFIECIIESNNAPSGLETAHVKEMLGHIESRKWKWEHIGTDETRNPRMIFRVTKK